MNRLVAAALLAAFATPALPAATPRPMHVDPRSATATFQEGQVYRINTRLRRATLIRLAPGERFLDFKAGDTESFQFSEAPRGDAILVKPVIAGAVTNGIIITNRRFYIVELHASASVRPHYSVSFMAPSGSGAQALRQTAVPPGVPKRYVVSARSRGAEITPVRVWDDGQRTYFQFSPDAPTPSVYRADAQGREAVVNVRTDGTVVTVGRRSDRWVIRYGDQYVCVQNEALSR